MWRTLFKFLVVFCILPLSGLQAQQQAYLLKPQAVYDGEQLHEGWMVEVLGSTINRVGPASALANTEGALEIDLSGLVLMPGLIEGHGHMFLYPYDQETWNNQVLKESQAYRTAKATVHARETLLAGVTTFRDLGTEGAGYADVGLKQAIEAGVIMGPRMIIATRALVTTGSYGPKGFASDFDMPIGAQVADGRDELIKAVREQIGKGADVIKVYADYRWGPQGEAQPTFTQDELNLIVEVASSSGRPVVAHAATAEGMRRAIEAGVQTIEHGDGATREVLKLMAENSVALCPTLAAVESIMQYRGWKKGIDKDPARIQIKKQMFTEALALGVPICSGGDVGVYEHGDNVLELELMVEYGMSVPDAIQAATSGNAKVLGLKQTGSIAPGLWADMIAVPAAAFSDIKKLREVKFVMKEGVIYKQ